LLQLLVGEVAEERLVVAQIEEERQLLPHQVEPLADALDARILTNLRT
jgi:hypothetical protein